LVGTPRSGTTLLQSLIASHPQLESFPESHFFTKLVFPGSQRNRLGLASKNSRRRFLEFTQELERSDLASYLPRHHIFIHQHANAFVKLLDDLTLEKNKKFWLEKTPDHLNRISAIEKYIPDAMFIHLMRNGAEVVASLYEVTQKYPDLWGEPWNIDKCINKWLEDRKRSCQCTQSSRHLIIHYSDLVSNTTQSLVQISKFLGLNFDSSVIINRSEVKSSLVLKHEPWKSGIDKPITNRGREKFDRLFSEDEKTYILSRLELESSSINN
jgi:hypothetical protein